MPATHVALIRGINVGRAKRVAMADLRSLFIDLGYGDVKTLLNSGNVVFGARGAPRHDPAARIERALAARLHISARVIVLDAAGLARIVDENSLVATATNPSRLVAAVFAKPADRLRVVPLLRQDWSPEALAVGARAAYQWCPDGIAKSAVGEAVSRALGDAATARNWATMMKLHALLAGA